MDDAECPFVNRYDGRCSEHLTMGGLGYAYRHCFDDFAGCPVYAELLAEVRETDTAGERSGSPVRAPRIELTIRRKALERAVRVA